MTHEQREQKELRMFGLLIGGVFTLIGLWPLVFGSGGPQAWAVSIGLGLVILAAMVPRRLKCVYRIWMAIGHVLASINTRILLGVVFYGLLAPMGLIMRALGRDPLHLSFEPDRNTYRVLRSPRPGSHMTRQF